ncbi:MAG TPA: hypothetical protein VKU39_03435 [Streptosporangiaceae bacterium]|nr:hypothetical protein [Streptosporangiaceae bacterium]
MAGIRVVGTGVVAAGGGAVVLWSAATGRAVVAGLPGVRGG